MDLEIHICPNCSSQLKIPSRRNFFVCAECGTKLKVDRFPKQPAALRTFESILSEQNNTRFKLVAREQLQQGRYESQIKAFYNKASELAAAAHKAQTRYKQQTDVRVISLVTLAIGGLLTFIVLSFCLYQVIVTAEGLEWWLYFGLSGMFLFFFTLLFLAFINACLSHQKQEEQEKEQLHALQKKHNCLSNRLEDIQLEKAFYESPFSDDPFLLSSE